MKNRFSNNLSSLWNAQNNNVTPTRAETNEVKRRPVSAVSFLRFIYTKPVRATNCSKFGTKVYYYYLFRANSVFFSAAFYCCCWFYFIHCSHCLLRKTMFSWIKYSFNNCSWEIIFFFFPTMTSNWYRNRNVFLDLRDVRYYMKNSVSRTFEFRAKSNK